MGHYDECREGYCGRCGQTIGNCEHTGKDSKAYNKHYKISEEAIKSEIKMNFGKAIEELKNGNRVARSGWNGKGIFIELQRPDKYSKMTSPYIFIDTTGLQTDNPDAPKSRVPWLASQTDLLAEDYYVIE